MIKSETSVSVSTVVMVCGALLDLKLTSGLGGWSSSPMLSLCLCGCSGFLRKTRDTRHKLDIKWPYYLDSALERLCPGVDGLTSGSGCSLLLTIGGLHAFITIGDPWKNKQSVCWSGQSGCCLYSSSYK